MPRTAITILALWAVSFTASVAETGPRSAEPAEIETAVAGGVGADGFHQVDEQMRELIEIALAENPALGSVWTQSRSSFERVAQERSLPDPQLGFRYFVAAPETRVGPQLFALELSQTVPWSGKRRLQGKRAENLAASRTWDAEDLERRLVAELKRTYYEAAYLQEALRVNEEDAQLLRRFERTALKRYSTGQGIQQSVVKVQTEISRLEDRGTALREQLEIVTRRLSERIGRPESELILEPIELTFPEFSFDRDVLERSAVEAHPRVRAVEQRVAGDRAWARRRKLESRPDFRFGVAYAAVDEREDLAGRTNPPEGNGDDILALTVGINIPLHGKRIRAGVAEAEESERARGALLSSVRNGLRQDIQQAALELDSLSERASLYREVIVPQAAESLASAEAAYTTDRLGFLDLLDAERVLFQSRLAYHRLVADLWIALADLELAAGRPLPSPSAEGRSR